MRRLLAQSSTAFSTRQAFTLLTLAFALVTAGPLVAESAAPNTMQADLLADFDRVSDKLNQLAETVPAEEFDHRPTLVVRSVSESLMHVASTNFLLAKTLGIDLPEDLPEDLEVSVTGKAEAITWLQRSQDAVRQALHAETDFNRPLRLFGGERSARTVFLITLGHSHEHLGQMIVYVRALGLVPPWSRPQS